MEETLQRFPICQVCGREPSVHCHEKLTRARGGSILDPANIVAVGWDCHRRIHDEPAWATEQGLLVPSWA